jgi:predicted DNA-binding protein with PD1-like motif
MRALKGEIGRICFTRLLENDDVAEAIKKHAQESNVKAGVFILIGALKQVVLGCYKEGEYVYTRMSGHVEVASCIGDIAVDEKGEIIIHAHIVVSNERGEAFGGHLMKGCLVSPTAELVIIEATGVNLRKAFDQKTKLNLLQLG